MMVCRMVKMKMMDGELVKWVSHCQKTSQRRKAGCRDETHLIISRTNASVQWRGNLRSPRPRKCGVSWQWLPLAASSQPPPHQTTQISIHHSRLYILSCLSHGCAFHSIGVFLCTGGDGWTCGAKELIVQNAAVHLVTSV